MKPRLVRPMDGDKIAPSLAEPVRKELMQIFHYENPQQAAARIMHIIKAVGDSGHLWMRTDGRIKVAGENYGAGPDETFIGVYGSDCDIEQLEMDVAYARSGKKEPAPTRRTRSITHEKSTINEVVETLPPVEALPVLEIPKPIPDPPPPEVLALPAPEMVESIGVLQKLEAARSAIDPEIAVVKIIRLLINEKARERIAFLLADYADLAQLSLDCLDDDGFKILSAHRDEAKEFSKLFDSDFGANKIITRLVKYLSKMEDISHDCVGVAGDEYAVEAQECAELIEIFSTAARN